jgi:arylsulfatase A-like enzyme
MKAFVAAVLLLLGAAVAAEAQGQPAGNPRPNVVLIITDDVGYGDFGSYGAPDIRTPNVDRLAREGVKLTDFYAAPTCTPTRASLIFMDLTASILAATNTPVPPDARLEGINLLPILEGRSAQVERTLFWRTQNQKAVRKGDWKLLANGTLLFLFNLRTDISERTDLAAQRGDLIREMRPLIAAWEADVDGERKGATR